MGAQDPKEVTRDTARDLSALVGELVGEGEADINEAEQVLLILVGRWGMVPRLGTQTSASGLLRSTSLSHSLVSHEDAQSVPSLGLYIHQS